MSLKVILLLPVLEILSFILFGDILGFFPVIFCIAATFLFGLYLLKLDNGIREIEKIGQDPRDWIYKKMAAILLIIPGFVTDLLGILLFFKLFRGFIWRHIPDVTKKSFYQKKENKEEIIEVDYRDLDDK